MDGRPRVSGAPQNRLVRPMTPIPLALISSIRVRVRARCSPAHEAMKKVSREAAAVVPRAAVDAPAREGLRRPPTGARSNLHRCERDGRETPAADLLETRPSRSADERTTSNWLRAGPETKPGCARCSKTARCRVGHRIGSEVDARPQELVEHHQHL